MSEWQGNIRRASTADAAVVTAILAEAFMRDPVSGWVFPADDHRARVHPAFFGPFVALALRTGEVHVAGDGLGATLWLPTGEGHDADEGDEFDEMEAAIGAEAMKRFGVLDEMMSARHPAEPHWYLPFIAVHPDHHGKGVGSALLRNKLAELDQAGTAAYLEASSPRNAALYERLGFRRRPLTLDLPEGPSLYPMWRDPA
ncbi:GNAT family N-acetyltransferase [Micromonospora aurantiaca]|uniref:GNAT family N-acetyltransferase n=1 Tax=Micromonospora aurantiaca (nom. illeg.) TaxID=47850 RepID=A0ABQ6UAN3_9ACTN|nr:MULTISPECIES: GNAT family N-acetyltransferase [Micromonospora]ADL47775.1 GCN5-related N-acetyltransferase [Micromonospora aurantiaca ATCC 27029]ADU09551.1 GCN5-related N-acetyltransferase [Micromonospora sp. L5]KAB1107822.1 GNAT family N-acetyltransferase [Micromonospora aurantiaca]OHX06753.1 GNAT family N-acetyltransferase [Micromonospora sp. WMMB235]RNH98677.1 N-acetyltransferase [Micromonospora aurantiaca]